MNGWLNLVILYVPGQFFGTEHPTFFCREIFHQNFHEFFVFTPLLPLLPGACFTHENSLSLTVAYGVKNENFVGR